MLLARVRPRGRDAYAEGDRADDMLLISSGTTRSDAVPWPEGNGARGPPERSPTLIGASAFLTRSARRETLRVAPERDPGGDPRARAWCIPWARRSSTASASARRRRTSRRYRQRRVRCRIFCVGSYPSGSTACGSARARRRTCRARRPPACSCSSRDASGCCGESGTTFAAGTDQGGYRARPNEERGRGETIGEAPLLAGGRYPSTAMCLRDSELVRMSRGALTLVCARTRRRRLGSSRRWRGSCTPRSRARPRDRTLVTVALVPARAGRTKPRWRRSRGRFDARSARSARRCGSTNRPRGTSFATAPSRV